MQDKYQLLEITPNETRAIVKLAGNVFGSSFASLIISKNHMWGYYATDGTDIVGAVILEKASQKEGVLSWIFVDKNARGYKLASRLMDKGFKALNDAGLKIQYATVRDDNTASWNMFYKEGYKVLPLHKKILGHSFKSFLKRLTYHFTTGYSVWQKDDSKTTSTYPKWPILRTLLAAALIGASLSLFGLRDFQFLIDAVIVVVSVTVLRILVAYPVARSSGKVRFMPSQGGFILSLILALSLTTWFPTFGFFVPKEEVWRDSTFKKNIAVQAFVTWMMLNLIFIGSALFFNTAFTSGVHIYLLLVILYQIFPTFPFDAFDGAKIFRWSKPLYVISVLLTLIIILLTYLFLF
jgi:ribosomal protein S18 acetylase RimI-like enzyme